MSALSSLARFLTINIKIEVRLINVKEVAILSNSPCKLCAPYRTLPKIFPYRNQIRGILMIGSVRSGHMATVQAVVKRPQTRGD